ncbi:alcohol dehydrogenase catalytic domain-containing protein [Actinoplanes sp. NPDC051411]|uniref:alcohol dehydrogenase catalytic domain-containing protein n=1 Tax=Actinoplanes sp. NPDC051411 TaxID=3155522 RepID=UPI0034201F36
MQRVVAGPSGVSTIDADVPAPGPGEVLVRTVLAGICGSDTHALAGRHPFIDLPYLPGHEVAGVVEATGQRVVLEQFLPCWECKQCRAGRPNVCEVTIPLPRIQDAQLRLQGSATYLPDDFTEAMPPALHRPGRHRRPHHVGAAAERGRRGLRRGKLRRSRQGPAQTGLEVRVVHPLAARRFPPAATPGRPPPPARPFPTQGEPLQRPTAAALRR